MIARLVSAVSSSTVSSAKRDALLGTLGDLLRSSFQMRREGGQVSKMAHAQGYADGYVRALVDAGLVSERDVLGYIQIVRRGVDGPATQKISSDDAVVAA